MRVQSWYILVVMLSINTPYLLSSLIMTKPTYYIVLAGGNGERLWPFSRKNKPKQLLEIGNKGTLLDQAIHRVSCIKRPGDKIWISTTAQHEAEIRATITEPFDTIIVEPSSRNTGPAILYNSFLVQKECPDATVVFLPADPYIPDEDNPLFCSTLETAVSFAHCNDAIVLLGITPIYPATGYGYIEYELQTQPVPSVYRVTRFHEKPSQECAKQYLQKQNMLWNTSIFCAPVSLFLQEFSFYAHDVYNAILRHVNNEDRYEASASISVDYAVIEKSKKIWVIPASFSWCDVGNVGVFLELKQQAAHDESAHVIAVDSPNNLIDAPGLVALVGVEGLCVIQTPDALLIANKDQAEKVREVVSHLKKHEMHEFL